MAEHSQKTVFIVDDDPAICRALSRLLGAEGYEVVTAATALEFFDGIEDDACGCAILDLQLPDVNGLEIQRSLARRGSGLQVIFLTGYGEVPSSVEAMKGGAVDYLEKPVEDEALLAAVEAALVRAAARHAEQSQQREVLAHFETLTHRERQVFELVVSGLLNKQIAGRLGIAERTVKVHRSRVMSKMGVVSLADLVKMAERLKADDA